MEECTDYKKGEVDMAFIKITRNKTGHSTEPVVTLMKKGVMAFNTAFCERYIKDMGYVELFYDPENNRLGIKPTYKNDKDMFVIRKYASSKPTCITIQAFVREFKIKNDETKVYHTTYNDKEKLIEIQLEK